MARRPRISHAGGGAGRCPRRAIACAAALLSLWGAAPASAEGLEGGPEPPTLAPTPGVEVSDVTVGEEAGTVTFTITRLDPTVTAVTYATADGTATAPGDYVAQASTPYAFADGEDSTTVTVDLADDSADEATESFDLVVTDPLTLAEARGTATVIDDDETLSVADAARVDEAPGGATATFTVSRSSADGGASVGLATADDTAVAGEDYTAKTESVSFADGELSKDVSVDVSDDAVDEEEERFALATSGDPTGAAVADGRGEAAIADDDPEPVASVAGESVGEGDGVATFSVTLSNPSSRTVTVDYATAAGTAGAGDYTGPDPGTLTFDPGETGPKTVSASVTDDVLDEEDETFTLALSGPANASVAGEPAVATILDDDAEPNLSVSDVEVDEGNAGTAQASFEVSLDAPSGREVKVDAATADRTARAPDDYSAVAKHTLTFAAGESTKTVTVDVRGDLEAEDDERFALELSDPVNAGVTDGTGLALVRNDDPRLVPDTGPQPLPSPVPDPEPPRSNVRGPSTTRLSDEWRRSTWAYVIRRTVARREPRAGARRVKTLRTVTSDYTPELVLLLRLRRNADGSEWVRARLPMRPNGTTGWIRRSDLGAFRRVKTAFRISRRGFRARLYRNGRLIWKARIGVGKRQWPTPAGRFYVRERLVPPTRDSIYGVFAFGTSAYSAVLTDWPGGGVVGIHGTNQPGLIPGRISHGCVRVRNRAIARLRRLMPLGTPIRIR